MLLVKNNLLSYVLVVGLAIEYPLQLNLYDLKPMVLLVFVLVLEMSVGCRDAFKEKWVPLWWRSLRRVRRDRHPPKP